jgi:hypothetical protein
MLFLRVIDINLQLYADIFTLKIDTIHFNELSHGIQYERYAADVDNLYHFNGFQCVQSTTRAEL